jgi:hypothetical protein
MVADLRRSERRSPAADTRAEPGSEAPITVTANMGSYHKGTELVKEDIQQQVFTLRAGFLGWDLKTIATCTSGCPWIVPEFMQVAVHSRVLSASWRYSSSLFTASSAASLSCTDRIGHSAVCQRIPEPLYPLFMAAAGGGGGGHPAGLLGPIRPLTPCSPLALPGSRSLATSPCCGHRQRYDRPAAGAADPRPVQGHRGPRHEVFQTLLYVICIVLPGRRGLSFPQDVLAFLQFAISVSVVCVFLLLMLNKRAAVLPARPALPQLPELCAILNYTP